MIEILRNAAVAPLFIARLLSSAGVGFGQLALAWGVLKSGYGPGGLSLVLACKAAPSLLILAGGIVGDRFRRHQVLAGAETLTSITWLAFAACFLSGKAPLILLCALATLSGIATAMFLPAIRGIIADLLTDDRRRVGNSLISQSDSIGLLIGLATSGLVVATVGPGWAAASKAALCASSVLLLMRLRTSRWDQPHRNPLSDLRTGWREFTSHRWVWVITLQFTAVIIAVASYTEIIGPLYMSQGHGGAKAWGIVTACEALGALLGAVLAARWCPQRAILVACALPASAAIPMLLLGSGTPWPILAATMLIPGICQSVFYVLWTTTLQGTFSPGVLARVNSWGIVGSFSLTPLALLLVGPFTKLIGAETAAVSSAAVILVATVAALATLTFRESEARDVPRASEAAKRA